MNIALLELLRAHPEAFCWPEALGRSLGISLKQVLADVADLERLGFAFEHGPHRGIRYVGPARRLCPDQIEWQLGTRTIGRRVAVWQRVTSTNDVAARAARSRSNDGLVVLAEDQTAGRGRRGRRWHTPPESSILMSVLIFPPPAASNLALLTSLGSIAVADVLIESLDLPARIKWPNDVRVNGRKVCGVLVEGLSRGRGPRGADYRRSSRPQRRRQNTPSESRPAGDSTTAWRAIVIGVGVNVNIEPRQFPPELADSATSLSSLCGRPLDRSDLARSLIQRLDHYYQRALLGDSQAIWNRWHDLADLVGRDVRVSQAGGEVFGRLVDVWPHRGVSLVSASGDRLELAAAEVLSISERWTFDTHQS